MVWNYARRCFGALLLVFLLLFVVSVARYMATPGTESEETVSVLRLLAENLILCLWFVCVTSSAWMLAKYGMPVRALSVLTLASYFVLVLLMFGSIPLPSFEMTDGDLQRFGLRLYLTVVLPLISLLDLVLPPWPQRRRQVKPA